MRIYDLCVCVAEQMITGKHLGPRRRSSSSQSQRTTPRPVCAPATLRSLRCSRTPAPRVLMTRRRRVISTRRVATVIRTLNDLSAGKQAKRLAWLQQGDYGLEQLMQLDDHTEVEEMEMNSFW
ncbi:hypothetical protein RB195_017946 [Necator americanus]|uniref:Uncharacterized protein n=1 Tax=Necator americanus TaxID=51031 RepID=A0ABR1C9J5_NECAM